MKDLKEYIKEGLFDDIDKIEGKNSLALNTKQLEKEIKDWVCNNYYTDQYCKKSKLLKKRSIKIDTSTSPPTVTMASPFPIYFRWGNSLNNNGMFQWGDVSDSFVSLSPILNTLDGAPKKVDKLFNCTHCVVESLEGGPEEVGEFTVKSRCLKNLKGMPTVKSHITVVSDYLTSLDGCPKVVEGDFLINCSKLKSLKGCSNEVKGDFICEYCTSLETLEGAPKEVGGNFNCDGCKSLKSLKGAPEEVGGGFSCYGCKSLTSLEGAPKKVGGDFDCAYCDNITTLKGCPEEVGGNFEINFNTSLKVIDYKPKKLGGKITNLKAIF